MADPDIDLATHIAANVGGLTLGTNVYHCPVGSPADGYAAKSVFCIGGGGPGPDADNGSTKRQHPDVVQVVVRGGKNDYRDGRDLVDSVRDAVEFAAVSGYISVRSLREPSSLGRDTEDRYLWSWDVEMLYEES